MRLDLTKADTNSLKAEYVGYFPLILVCVLSRLLNSRIENGNVILLAEPPVLCTPHQIMSVLIYQNKKDVETYVAKVRNANRTKMAGRDLRRSMGNQNRTKAITLFIPDCQGFYFPNKINGLKEGWHSLRDCMNLIKTIS